MIFFKTKYKKVTEKEISNTELGLSNLKFEKNP